MKFYVGKPHIVKEKKLFTFFATQKYILWKLFYVTVIPWTASCMYLNEYALHIIKMRIFAI